VTRACLITGGGTGIGAATARRLAADGWSIAVNGRRLEPIETVAAELGGLALAGDVGDEQAARAVVAAALERFGRLDGLVLNAGAAGGGSVLEQTTEQFRRVLRTNVEGAFHVARAALPALLAQGGAIVTVASLAAQRVAASSAAYCASKAAAVMLTQSMAVDYGPRGVRANVVCPAWIRTDLADRSMDALAARRGVGRDDAYAEANRDVPLRRAGTPQEVAEAIAWLLSDASSYVNGAVLRLDGGAAVVDVPSLAFGEHSQGSPR
jgi:NAD(P)-dependent dehydrogenase (short-subunit alcohol dehydrogenase family)